MSISKLKIILSLLLLAPIFVFVTFLRAATVATSPKLSSEGQGLTKGLVGYWTFDGKDMKNGAIREF